MTMMKTPIRRILAGAAILAAAAAPILAPSPAKAWWVRGVYHTPAIVVRPPVIGLPYARPYFRPAYVGPAYAPPLPYAVRPAVRPWAPPPWHRHGPWAPGPWR